MDNPEISGVMYQQGELMGYEVRSYLLEKYAHICQYCNGETKDTILEVEHKTSKANGGSNKITNHTNACHTCNDEKRSNNLEDWLKQWKERRHTALTQTRIKCIIKALEGQIVGKSQRYNACVNSYRKKMIHNVKE